MKNNYDVRAYRTETKYDTRDNLMSVLDVQVPAEALEFIRAAPTFLGVSWPFFLLGSIGEDACKGVNMLDLLCPATVQGLRDTYRPVLARTNPTAAAGLDATPDDELTVWVKVLRAELLGRSEFTPAFLFHQGQTLRGLAQVVRLPLFERQDVFLAACHQRGQEQRQAAHA